METCCLMCMSLLLQRCQQVLYIIYYYLKFFLCRLIHIYCLIYFSVLSVLGVSEPVPWITLHFCCVLLVCVCSAIMDILSVHYRYMVRSPDACLSAPFAVVVVLLRKRSLTPRFHMSFSHLEACFRSIANPDIYKATVFCHQSPSVAITLSVIACDETFVCVHKRQNNTT